MLRAAVVGTGLIARRKHLPAWRTLARRAHLQAICDLDRTRAEEAARDFGIPEVYTDLRELLQREHPDIVDICTPPATHASLAVEALRGGAHVLVEKPLAVSVAECDAILESASMSGRQVAVAHSDLFYPSFMRARRLMESGVLGEYRAMRVMLSTPTDYITSQADHWAHTLAGGVVGETGPHVVYISLPFIGTVEGVHVTASKVLPQYPWSSYEDYRIVLAGEKGVSSIDLLYSTNQWAAVVELWGSTGAVRADLQSQAVVRYDRDKLSPLTVGRSALSAAVQGATGTLATVVRRIVKRGASTHATLIEAVLTSIEKDRPMPVSGEDGREAVRTMRRIQAELA